MTLSQLFILLKINSFDFESRIPEFQAKKEIDNFKGLLQKEDKFTKRRGLPLPFDFFFETSKNYFLSKS